LIFLITLPRGKIENQKGINMRRVFTFLLVLLIFAATQSEAQNVSLYAGTPNQSGSNPTVTPKLNAKFNNPVGLAFDKHGYLWVSEWSSHTIRMITPDGYVYTKAGGVNQDCFKNASATSSRFSNPSGMCVGPDDTLYVADHGNHCIRKIDPSLGSPGNNLWVDVKAGKFSAPGAGNPNCLTRHPGYKDGPWLEAQFENPADVDCDAAGNIYVADQGNHCIRKIGINGMVTTIAGIPDSAGNADGNALGQALFNWPVGIYVHNNGDIYVAEYQNSQLRKISNGQVTTVLGYPPLWTPNDVYIDSRGILYISDLHRIVRWDGSNWSTFAGGAYHNGPSGYVNDTATAARFNDTRQMVVDPNDYHFVYVTDFNNHVIRKVTICDPYKPDVSLSGGTVFCKGDQLTLTAADGYQTYKWSTGEETKSITVTSTMDVWLEVLNNDLCRGYSDTFNITVYKLKPSVTPTATSFCAGDSAFLVGQSGFSNYAWYKNGVKIVEGPGEQTLTVKDSGDYMLEVISGPCKGTSDMIHISLGQLTPSLNYSGNKVLCLGDSLIVESNGTYNSYQWKKDGNVIATTRQIVVKEAGTYTLFASNAAGCSGTSEALIITTYPKPAKPTISTSGDSILVSSSMTGNQWYRNDTLLQGSTAPGYYATIPGWYTVEVMNQYGCSAMSDPYPFGGVGIEPSTLNGQILLYPNPSEGVLNLSIKSATQGEAIVQLYSVLGELMFSDKIELRKQAVEKQYNFDHLEKAMYFVLIRMDGQTAVQKVLIR
jgi:sugar lactone lactonase YvrE